MTSAPPAQEPPRVFTPASVEAIRITNDACVFDTLALSYVLDEPYTERCLAAGVNGANVSIVAEATWEETLRALEGALSRIARHPLLVLATSTADIRAARAAGRLAVVPVTQDAAMIGDAFWRLDTLVRLGLRSIGLAYTSSNLYADGCGEPRDAGLTFLGREFIAAVNGLPLVLDLSHVGHRSRAEAVALARAPACTHANAYAIAANDRNITDDLARAVCAKGGALGVCGLPSTVRRTHPTVGDLAEHIAHFGALVGRDRVGFGLDLNEGYRGGKAIPPASLRWRSLRPDIFGTVDDFFHAPYPAGIATVSELPHLAQALIDRDWPEPDIRGVLGENWLQFFAKAVG